MHEIAPSACWPTPSCLRDDVFERRKLFVRRRLLRGVPQWERVAAVSWHVGGLAWVMLIRSASFIIIF